MLEAITTTTTERRHPGVSTSSSVNFCKAEDTDGRVCTQIQMSMCKIVTFGAGLICSHFHFIVCSCSVLCTIRKQISNRRPLRTAGLELLDSCYYKILTLHTTYAPKGFYSLFPVCSFITVILKKDKDAEKIPALLCRSCSLFSSISPAPSPSHYWLLPA